jgi:parallel beta-helix repeat protein
MRGRNVSALLVVLVILSSFSVLVTILPENVRAATLYVGGGGPGNYTTIQGAIDAAFTGDTVFVFNGTYNEETTVSKSLSMIGDDKVSTIIEASGNGDAILVTSDSVIIDGFNLTRATGGRAGVQLSGVQNCVISNNSFYRNDRAIELDSSHDNVITGNHVLRSGEVGLEFSDGNLILNNTFVLNTYGVRLDSSHQNTIAGNNILEGTYIEILVYESHQNRIVGNDIVSKERFQFYNAGIWLYTSNGTTLSDNRMVHNGIFITGDPLANWATHDIDSLNTVNSGPVYYWKDVIGGQVPVDAGQVILVNCTDVLIEGTNVTDGTAGILVGFSENITIRNNNVSFNERRGMTLHFTNNSTISNNSAMYGLYGIHLSYSDNTVIDGCNTSWGGWALHLSDSHNNTISNTESYYSGYGMVITLSHGNTIEGNIALWSGWGIHLGYSNNNTVVNNNASYSLNWGFDIYRSYGNLVSNNTAFDNNVGFYFNGCHYSNVSMNVAVKNAFSGIGFWRSDRNIASLNTATHNGDGVEFVIAHNNTLHSNDIMNNDIGVHVRLSYGNNIHHNYIGTNTGIGVKIDSSSGNLVYHNSIIDNVQQAFDDTDSNQWDDGYPSGGNWWSDYNGIDLMWGPLQNLPGPDGIGDTPYVIDADSEDRYPLMGPPPAIYPRPPIILQADLTGYNSSNVTIVWALSPDDGAGLYSVTRYDIYRNSTYEPAGSGYALLTSVPNGTYEFIDILAGEGDPNNYFYIVCAVNMTNDSSCSADQAGKFTRPLSEGPNLVSVPLIQSDDGIETVLQTVNWDKAWTYDSSLNAWMSHMLFKPYRGQLKRVDHKMGLWVNVTNNSNLTVAGLVPSSTDIQLKSGWNLVGFPSFSTTFTVADLKADTGATRVEGYDPSSSPYFLREMLDSDILQAGEGYWIYLPLDLIWTVQN